MRYGRYTARLSRSGTCARGTVRSRRTLFANDSCRRAAAYTFSHERPLPSADRRPGKCTRGEPPATEVVHGREAFQTESVHGDPVTGMTRQKMHLLLVDVLHWMSCKVLVSS